MSVEAHEVIPIPRSADESIPEAARRRVSSPWATGVVLVITVLWTVPTIGLFVTSIRPTYRALESGWWNVVVDRTVTLDNYQQVLNGGDTIPEGITPYFFNSFAIAIPATVLPILVALMAAYALAWIPFRGANTVFLVIFAMQVLPIQLALLPLLELFSNGWSIGPIPIFPNVDNPETGRSALTGTYVPMWFAHTAFALPLAIYLMHNFMARLPREIMDAARVDGASHYVIFLRIVLPLSVPAIAAFAIFQFLWVWNDLLVAISFAGGTPDVAPITSYLAGIQGAYGVHMHLVTAGAFVAIIVPITLFFALQRYFVRGLVAGSVEG